MTTPATGAAALASVLADFPSVTPAAAARFLGVNSSLLTRALDTSGTRRPATLNNQRARVDELRAVLAGRAAPLRRGEALPAASAPVERRAQKLRGATSSSNAGWGKAGVKQQGARNGARGLVPFVQAQADAGRQLAATVRVPAAVARRIGQSGRQSGKPIPRRGTVDVIVRLGDADAFAQLVADNGGNVSAAVAATLEADRGVSLEPSELRGLELRGF